MTLTSLPAFLASEEVAQSTVVQDYHVSNHVSTLDAWFKLPECLKGGLQFLLVSFIVHLSGT